MSGLETISPTNRVVGVLPMGEDGEWFVKFGEGSRILVPRAFEFNCRAAPDALLRFPCLARRRFIPLNLMFGVVGSVVQK
jgi:hypothetical protein